MMKGIQNFGMWVEVQNFGMWVEVQNFGMWVEIQNFGMMKGVQNFGMGGMSEMSEDIVCPENVKSTVQAEALVGRRSVEQRSLL